MKKAFSIACTGCLVLTVLVVYLVNQGADLRRDKSALHARVAELELLKEENERLRQAQAGLAELEKLREGHRELLQLRAEVSRLRPELEKANQSLKAAQAAAARNAAASSPGQESQSEAAGTPFQAVLQSRLAPQQSLLTGGWATADGKRSYVLLSPAVIATQDGPAQITVSQVFFELPQNVLESVGLDAFVAEGRTSNLQGVLDAADLKTLLQALTDTQAVDILSAPAITTLSGRQAQVRIGGPPDPNSPETPTGLTVDLVPTAVPGTGEIDLNVVIQMPGK